MFKPAFDEAKKLAANYGVVPLSCEIFADIRTPVEVLRILKNVDSHCFLLEGVEDTKVWGRYSFLGFDPVLEITCRNNVLKIGTKEIQTEKPQKYIKETKLRTGSLGRINMIITTIRISFFLLLHLLQITPLQCFVRRESIRHQARHRRTSNNSLQRQEQLDTGEHPDLSAHTRDKQQHLQSCICLTLRLDPLKPTFPKSEGFTSSDFTISIISDGSTIKPWKKAYCDSHVSRQCQRSRVPSERPFR